MSGPHFDDLVDPGVTGAERERLRRTHDLLVAVGAPPELPPSLVHPPGQVPEAELRTLPRGLPRRRLAATIVLAAALALAAFAAGYLAGDRGTEPAFPTDFVLAMRGTDAAPDARASLAVGRRDGAGNWPMTITVRGLETLRPGARYELFLTRDGRAAQSCGTFVVAGDKTVVFLNAPFRLKRFAGWIVTREDSERILLRTAEI